MRFGRLREKKNMVPLPEIDRDYPVVHSFAYSLFSQYGMPGQACSTFHVEQESSEKFCTHNEE
jgi:hypothetical protein